MSDAQLSHGHLYYPRQFESLSLKPVKTKQGFIERLLNALKPVR